MQEIKFKVWNRILEEFGEAKKILYFILRSLKSQVP
ncbi:unnamed protein product [Arabidopsis halleri]